MELFVHRPKGLAAAVIKEMTIVEVSGDTMLSLPSFPVGYPFISVITSSRFRVKKDGKSETMHSSLIGQYVSPFLLELPLIDRALNIQIQPWALQTIFRHSPFDFYDGQTPLELIDAELTRKLEDCISGVASSESVLRKVEQVICDLIDQSRFPDERAVEAWTQILRKKGDIKTKELANHVNLSPRRLQQIFKETIGITAKGYSRIARVQFHTHQFLTGSTDFVFTPDSYFDQAHFIHDVREQTGMAPQEFSNFMRQMPQQFAYLKSNLFNQYSS